MKNYDFENAPKERRETSYRNAVKGEAVGHTKFLRLFGYAIIIACAALALIQAFGG